MLYEWLIKPCLFRVDPEKAHHFAVSLMAGSLTQPFFSVNRMLNGFRSERLRTDLCGIPLENPVGLAAGFDKNAVMYPNLHRLGFAYVEIGTVTAEAQSGNPKPRIFRLPEDNGLINRLGFNNDGAEVISTRLARRHAAIPLGGNIGKSKVAPLDRAVDDYTFSFNLLKPHVDYFVVNVSSPNTPDLRKLQAREPLQKLLDHLQQLNKDPQLPLLLKIAPDLNEDQLIEIVEVVTSSGIDGVIATNTTITRNNLKTSEKRVADIGAGGLSGAPVRDMATGVIAFLRKHLPRDIPIVGVGGIFTGADAYEKIRHGASCVQIYTGLVYGGQNTVFRILKELDRLLVQDGFQSVKDAVGVALKD
ncbi:MAG: quinone-dependent dihydroorotate dehydrogenase [Acidobacteriota bacterium]|nr:quinone-dependent dihydroorotate dehydrogenase [Acidobacteriota bacterium]